VLEQFRLPDPQDVPRFLQPWDVGFLVAGVGHYQAHIDDGLGGEAGDGRGTHVFQLQDALAQRSPNPAILVTEQLRPGWVVLGQGHRGVVFVKLSHVCGADLGVGQRFGTGRDSGVCHDGPSLWDVPETARG
jgi:hypothetical protein